MTALERHRRLTPVRLAEADAWTKPGVRGFPDLPPALAAFRELRQSVPFESLVDASGTAGLAAQVVAAGAAGAAAPLPPGGGGDPRSVVVHEPSCSALLAAGMTAAGSGAAVRAGLPWDLEPAQAQSLLLAPPFDRGNARVVAELNAAATGVSPDGLLLIALHKDGGAKRYLKVLAELFGDVDILARSGGWRLVRAGRPSPARAQPLQWLGFEAAGMPLASLPGVHAAGKVDPGTAQLVQAVPWGDLSGRRVLDLGCGYGLLALLASRSGAVAVAADDDLAAVRSCARNSAELDLAVDVRHSDIDSALVGERFDVVLCNPPFHVGRGVRLDVPLAFIEAARTLLAPGGQLWLVANRDLPYERALGDWPGGFSQVRDEGGFKVLVART